MYNFEPLEAVANYFQIDKELELEEYLIELMTYKIIGPVHTDHNTPLWKNKWNLMVTRFKRYLNKYIKKYPPHFIKHVELLIENCYEEAVFEAVMKTGLPTSNFPKECPFTLESLLKEEQ